MRRLLLAVALALGTTALPTTTALACTCGFSSHEEAAAAADVAFIGTVVHEREPGLFAEGTDTARYSFDVERSKMSLPSPFEIDSWFGSDAGCGFDMTVGEEWLVMAAEREGRLETHLCMGTTLTDELDPDELDRIEAALPLNDVAFEDAGFTLDLPAPVIGILATSLVMGAVGVLAFRRDRPR
jgi:hypothetical protein